MGVLQGVLEGVYKGFYNGAILRSIRGVVSLAWFRGSLAKGLWGLVLDLGSVV